MKSLNAYRDARVLVLGASGFIGRWVGRILSPHCTDLHLAVWDPEAIEALRIPYGLAGRVWRADFAGVGAAEALCAELRPAIVFNVAGYGVDPMERSEAVGDALNRRLPCEVAGAMVRYAAPSWRGQHLVHAGSALEYGPVDGPVSEALPSRPTTMYGRTKLAGSRCIEESCGKSGLRAVATRIFTVYGPGEHSPRLLPSLLRGLASAAPLELTTGDQRRDFVYVREVAEALVQLGLSQRPGFDTVNVATGTLRSVREFTALAAGVLGLAPERLRFGALPYLAEEMWHGPVAIDLLRERLGWTPALDVAEGVRDAVAFLSKNGLL